MFARTPVGLNPSHRLNSRSGTTYSPWLRARLAALIAGPRFFRLRLPTDRSKLIDTMADQRPLGDQCEREHRLDPLPQPGSRTTSPPTLSRIRYRGYRSRPQQPSSHPIRIHRGRRRVRLRQYTPLERLFRRTRQQPVKRLRQFQTSSERSSHEDTRRPGQTRRQREQLVIRNEQLPPCPRAGFAHQPARFAYLVLRSVQTARTFHAPKFISRREFPHSASWT